MENVSVESLLSAFVPTSRLGQQIADDIHSYQRTYRELKPSVADDGQDGLAFFAANEFLEMPHRPIQRREFRGCISSERGLAKQIADVSKSSVARLGLFIFYGSNERPPSFPIDLGVSAGCDRRVAAAAGGKYVHELRDERIIPIVGDNAPLSDPTSTRRTLADADHT
jgi:hypothetical protein